MKPRLLAVLTIALALLLAACGGGGSKDASSTSTTEGLIGTGDAQGPAGPPVPGVTVTSSTLPAGAPGRTTAAPWSAPVSNVTALIRRAGLEALPSERLEYHIHAHLDVFVDGDEMDVPANIGIDLSGGQLQAIAPLHTHDTTGLIHVENAEPASFYLSQLFNEWDVRLDTTCVGGYCRPAKDWAIYVDGVKDTRDPAKIEFGAHREIAVVVGKAPASIPKKYDFPPGT